jgi:hypothetical protein
MNNYLRQKVTLFLCVSMPTVLVSLVISVGQITPQGVYGLGDMNPTFFLSPAKPGKSFRVWDLP